MKALFLKVYIHLDFPQHSGDSDAVECVSSKPADGFDDDHIHLSAPALADQLVELVPFFHAGAGDAFVGVDPGEFPVGFPIDAVGIIPHLCFVAVELFFLLGGYPAVCRYSFISGLCAGGIHRLNGWRNDAHPLLRCWRRLLHLISPL